MAQFMFNSQFVFRTLWIWIAVLRICMGYHIESQCYATSVERAAANLTHVSGHFFRADFFVLAAFLFILPSLMAIDFPPSMLVVPLTFFTDAS